MRLTRDWLLIPGLALLGVALFMLFGLNRRFYVLLGESADPGVSPAQVQIGYPAVIESSSSATIEVAVYLEPQKIPELAGQDIHLEAGLWTSKVELSPPNHKQETVISDAASQTLIEHKWTWTARPQGVGKYHFILTVKGEHQAARLFDYTQTFQVTVLDLFGLSVGQARALGGISGLVGGILVWLALRSIWATLRKIQV